MLFCLRAVFWISLISLVLSQGDLSQARTRDFLVAAHTPISAAEGAQEGLQNFCSENQALCDLTSQIAHSVGQGLRVAFTYAGERLEQETQPHR